MTTPSISGRISHSGIAAARRAARRTTPTCERTLGPQCAPGRSLCAIAMGQVTADGRWSIGTTTLGQAVGVTCRKLVAR
jgi:hypothetical protein